MAGQSDIDVLVVVERPLRDDELGSLEGLLTRWVEATPEESDVRVVTRPVAASPTPSPAMELYVGLLSGLALVGEPASTVIGAVRAESLHAVGDRYLARWQELTDDDKHAELTVLTACRIWRFAAEGVHCSKADAGAWALARDHELEAVRGALQRHSGEAAAIALDDVALLLTRVRAELAR